MAIISFFSHPFFIVVSGFLSLLFVLSVLYGTCVVVTGVWPVWLRLGKGLVNRRIAVFADEKFSELESLLTDSDIFRAKNIIRVNREDIKKAQDISIMLVHWKSFFNKIDDILAIKKDTDALIVYAPIDEGRLENDDMVKINTQRNAALVNFRGRLLNDITQFMITTAYTR